MHSSNVTTIVSGLPRTGTSMMMKMLEAGGIPVLADNIREADEDNLGGYYELEKVKEIKDDTAWLDGARGKVFKMVSMLLYDLPADREYAVVFMERDLSEVLASQRKMLERMGKPVSDEDDSKTRALYEKHLAEIKEWLRNQGNFSVLFLKYNDVINDPSGAAAMLDGFLGRGLDVDRMAAVANPELYRNRAGALAAASPSPAAELPSGDEEEDEEAIKERLKGLGYM
ncbi:MAG: sulfotransferase domain-containing protein [Nitrospirae bacterium]|nr:sulfotransferase domain-containing protein [Nitrospirota bacterium]